MANDFCIRLKYREMGQRESARYKIDLSIYIKLPDLFQNIILENLRKALQFIKK